MSTLGGTLAAPPRVGAGRFLLNVVIKAALLFVAIDLLVAVVDPLPALGRLTAYNTLLPGRLRLAANLRREQRLG